MPNIGLPSDYLTPVFAVKINFGVGQSNAGGGTRDAVYFAAMASTGTATPNTKYKIKDQAQADELFAAQSPAAWTVKSHLKCWRGGNLYVIPYAASSGGGATTATAVIQHAGTATKAGAVTVTMFNRDRVVGFANGATAAEIADLVTGAINGMGWIVSAATSSENTVISAPIPGESQNDIYKVGVSVTANCGITVTTDAYVGDGTSGADGTTTELSNFQAALDANIADSSYYVGVSAKEDEDYNGALHEYLAAKLTLSLSNRSRGFIAGSVAKAELQDAAVAENYELMQLIGEPDSEYDPAWLTGQVVAWEQAQERLYAAVNMTSGASIESNAVWHLDPVRDTTLRMTGDDINDLMADGVTAIRSVGNKSFLNASLTTASKDPTGSFNDRRKWSSHVISVGHYVAEFLEQRAAVTYAGFNLAHDRKDSSGRVITKYKKRTLYPSTAVASIIGWIGELDGLNLLDEVESKIIPSVTADIDSLNNNRLEATLDSQAIAILMQFLAEVNEVTPG
jgi:phage tail sheath gpL-like